MSEIPSLTEHMKKKGLLPPDPIESPNPFVPRARTHMLICGTTGAGKTEFVTAMLIDDRKGDDNIRLPYQRVFLYTQVITPQWEYVIKVFKAMEKKLKRKILWHTSNLADVIPIDAIDKTYQNVVVFDDFMNERNQNVVVDYFSRGRHMNCSCIYITQSYKKADVTIRKQCKYFAFFKGANDDDLESMKKTFRPPGIRNNKIFIELYDEVTSGSHDFIFIDEITDQPILMFRKNLNGLLIK